MSATAYPSPPTLPSFAPGAIARALKDRAAKASDPNAGEEAVTPSVDDDGKVRPLVGEVVILGIEGEEVSGEEQGVPEVVGPPSEVSPWPALMASASDHTDDHLAKVSRTRTFSRRIVPDVAHAGHPHARVRSDALCGLATWDVRLVPPRNRHHGRQHLRPRSVPPSLFLLSLTVSHSRWSRLPRARLGPRRRPPRLLGPLRPRLRLRLGRPPPSPLERPQG